MSAGAGGRHRDKLAQYYCTTDQTPEGRLPPTSAHNIDSANFDPELYTQHVIKEASLAQLMALEGDIVKQIHSLDSDMQTLVYENYNKFIAATDTIKKMRVDFKSMESEMDKLADKMQLITDSSKRVSNALTDRRRCVAELAGTHALLRKLQFLFDLPSRLKDCIDQENWPQAVSYYLRTEKVLEQYQNMPSFGGIKRDCDTIVQELRQRLTDKLLDANTTHLDLTNFCKLLVQLRVPPAGLSHTFLSTAAAKLDSTLSTLEHQLARATATASADLSTSEELTSPELADTYTAMDMLEFVDLVCNSFLSDVCLVIVSFMDIFCSDTVDSDSETDPMEKLTTFVDCYIGDKLFDVIQRRAQLETNLDESSVLARAMDRFYRRMQVICRLMPASSATDLTSGSLDLVLKASRVHSQLSLQFLERCFQDGLLQARRVLVISGRRQSISSEPDGDPKTNLKAINSQLLSAIVENMQKQMNNLQVFIDPELTYAVKSQFRTQFCCVEVREAVFVAFFRSIWSCADQFCQDTTTPPILLLLLSRTCLDLQTSTTEYLLSRIDDKFLIDEETSQQAAYSTSSLSQVNEAFRKVAQKLLNHYVRMQGQVLSQMIRKSMETRNWAMVVEPRTVRAVMKRVVEEASSMDQQVCTLYEDGSKKARSSDSSRRTRPSHSRSQFNRTSGWSMAANTLNTSLVSNIHKMFFEKIEIFSPVDFSRISIMTGIVKIALKTLLECVRMRTFSRFGFQQMQVDTHYLSLFLWRFVSDENLIGTMLDEVMTSTVHRCPDPVPMESSVVDVLCDRS